MNEQIEADDLECSILFRFDGGQPRIFRTLFQRQPTIASDGTRRADGLLIAEETSLSETGLHALRVPVVVNYGQHHQFLLDWDMKLIGGGR